MDGALINTLVIIGVSICLDAILLAKYRIRKTAKTSPVIVNTAIPSDGLKPRAFDSGLAEKAPRKIPNTGIRYTMAVHLSFVFVLKYNSTSSPILACALF